MGLVREGVDHRVAHVARELLGDLLAEGADEETVTVAVDDARRVANGLAARGLHLVGAHVEGLGPELRRAGLEADARARRKLLEDHREGLATQGFEDLTHGALALELDRRVDEVADLLGGEVGELQEVLALEMVEHLSAPPRPGSARARNGSGPASPGSHAFIKHATRAARPVEVEVCTQ